MSSSVVESPVADTVNQLIADEEQVFLRRQPRSSELIAEARVHLAGGATSNWQIAEPQAVWMSHGSGSKVYDVDGNEYVDMHGGYGASIAGHAHPAIVEAVSDRVRRGTHFAQPTEDAIWIARRVVPSLRASAVALRQLGHRVGERHSGRSNRRRNSPAYPDRVLGRLGEVVPRRTRSLTSSTIAGWACPAMEAP